MAKLQGLFTLFISGIWDSHNLSTFTSRILLTFPAVTFWTLNLLLILNSSITHLVDFPYFFIISFDEFTILAYMNKKTKPYKESSIRDHLLQCDNKPSFGEFTILAHGNEKTKLSKESSIRDHLLQLTVLIY